MTNEWLRRLQRRTRWSTGMILLGDVMLLNFGMKVQAITSHQYDALTIAAAVSTAVAWLACRWAAINGRVRP